MEACLTVIRTTRQNFLNLVNGLSLDELNQIPAGFNNNIIWNFGHVIAAQQALCYKLTNTPPRIEEELILKYRRGTKPEGYVPETEFITLKEYLFSTINDLEQDLKADLFQNFTPYMTSMGTELTSINDAVHMLPMHDGLHLGYALALRRLIQR